MSHSVFDDTVVSSSSLNSFSALETLSIEELRGVWLSMFRRPAPRSFYRNMLIRVIAYEKQAHHYGDLPKRLRTELRTLAGGEISGGVRKGSAALALTPGSRLVRTWRGALHEVTVQEHGYEWRGETYNSLSRIAREITGTHWNGLRFFAARAAISARGDTVEAACD